MVLEDAERLIGTWNEHQAKGMADAVLADDGTTADGSLTNLSRPALSRVFLTAAGPAGLALLGDDSAMGFNRRKMEAERKAKADTEAKAKRATDAQVLADAEALIWAWNEASA